MVPASTRERRAGSDSRATKRFASLPTLQRVTVIAVDTVTERLRWESAYRSAYPQVYRGLIALGARPDEAEDALQDAFTKGLSRHAGQMVTIVDGWIYVVASRAWRRRRIRERLFLPWRLLTDREAPQTDVTRDVLAALRALPLRQRQIVVARYVIGLSQLETAALLGISRGTVSATTTQAIAALRRVMEVER